VKKGGSLIRDQGEVRVLPPIVLGAALALQALIAFLFPMRFIPNAVAIAAGTAVIAASVALVLLAVRDIKRAGTAFDSHKQTTAIVTIGAYRFTRNPVYFAMLLLVVGVGLMLNSPLALLLAIPTGSALCLTAIRPEERYLEGKFDREYRGYRDAVPRWLSPRRLSMAILELSLS
jgi:protein-S-isoprenylcysteine O-methyltransferase Ste14